MTVVRHGGILLVREKKSSRKEKMVRFRRRNAPAWTTRRKKSAAQRDAAGDSVGRTEQGREQIYQDQVTGPEARRRDPSSGEQKKKTGQGDTQAIDRSGRAVPGLEAATGCREEKQESHQHDQHEEQQFGVAGGHRLEFTVLWQPLQIRCSSYRAAAPGGTKNRRFSGKTPRVGVVENANYRHASLQQRRIKDETEWSPANAKAQCTGELT